MGIKMLRPRAHRGGGYIVANCNPIPHKGESTVHAVTSHILFIQSIIQVTHVNKIFISVRQIDEACYSLTFLKEGGYIRVAKGDALQF